MNKNNAESLNLQTMPVTNKKKEKTTTLASEVWQPEYFGLATILI